MGEVQEGAAFWRMFSNPLGPKFMCQPIWSRQRHHVATAHCEVAQGQSPSPGQLTSAPAPTALQKLEEQELRARRLKEKLRSKQQSLQRQLEQLRGLPGAGERLRADSLDSSGLSSERSDSDQGECPEAERPWAVWMGQGF